MKHKEIRCTHFVGTAKEIAKQFLIDLDESIAITAQYAPVSAFSLYLDRQLYRIIAAYYGEQLCLYADKNVPSAIQGIPIEWVFNNQGSDTIMFGMWALKDGKLFDYLPGTYMYKEV
jgi:hypothetical protein